MAGAVTPEIKSYFYAFQLASLKLFIGGIFARFVYDLTAKGTGIICKPSVNCAFCSLPLAKDEAIIINRSLVLFANVFYKIF